MEITNVICPESKYEIKCPLVTEKDGICVHNTANDASAMSEVSYMLGNNNKVSFHAAVDNYRVVTGLPFNRSCYAAGDGRYGKGNAHKINIEICYSKTGGENFEEAEDLAACYIAYLLKKYNWGLDKVTNIKIIVENIAHIDLDLGWEKFLNKIREQLGIQNKPVESNQNYSGGSDEPVRKYVNGSTRENIYSDTELTKKIGYLNPRGICDCFGIFNNRPMVRYKVNGSNNYKIGFAVWKGGVK